MKALHSPFPSGLRLLSKTPLSNVASVSIASLSLPEARIVLRGSGGMVTGAPVTMQFNGDSGSNYLSGDFYAQGTGAFAANPPGTNSRSTGIQLALTAAASAVAFLSVDIDVFGAKSDGPPHVNGRFISKGTADSNFIYGCNGGLWDQTAADVSSAVISFGAGANFTGTLYLYG